MLFVVTVKYKVPLETIQIHLEPHIKFLESHYAQGTLIASGPQVPWVGGVIIAKASSQEALQDILKDDPFWIHDLAEYHVLEFIPTLHAPCLSPLLRDESLAQ